MHNQIVVFLALDQAAIRKQHGHVGERPHAITLEIHDLADRQVYLQRVVQCGGEPLTICL